MKTGIYLLIFIAWLAIGCSDFLNESSSDEIRPSTLTDLEQLLLGDGYEDAYNFYYCTEIFTDNIKSNGAKSTDMQTAHDKDKWKFIWDENMFTESESGYDAAFWQGLYEGILGCNLVLDNLDQKDGEHKLRESLRGEALTLRAWYYLHLVNFFGIAYNQGNPDTDLGVPLKLNSTVTGEFFPRNTVREVYSRIEQDLLEGNRLLTEYDYDRDYFRMGHLAAKAILSRLYLYMEEWDKALEYAGAVLAQKADLLDLNTLKWQGLLASGSAGCVYLTTSPDEIIWGRQQTKAFTKGIGIGTPFSVSNELWSTYENGSYTNYTAKKTHDIRSFMYFSWSQDISALLSGGELGCRDGISKAKDDFGGYQGIRTAELYLNRAEVYARKYLAEGNESYRQAALADLNELRRHRFNKAFPYEDADITDGQELLDFCLAERRRELCGETNHRWCDLRRLGITVTHVLVENGETEYKKDMSHYCLPIPEKILEYNPLLEQNK